MMSLARNTLWKVQDEHGLCLQGDTALVTTGKCSEDDIQKRYRFGDLVVNGKSDHCLTLTDTDLTTAACRDTEDQKFTFANEGDLSFTIKQDQRCLIESSSHVSLRRCNHDQGQQWIVRSFDTGAVMVQLAEKQLW